MLRNYYLKKTNASIENIPNIKPLAMGSDGFFLTNKCLNMRPFAIGYSAVAGSGNVCFPLTGLTTSIG